MGGDEWVDPEDFDGGPVLIGDFLIPTDPADLTVCDGCQ